MSTLVRKIIHVDMDAFYASVEQRDRPELRGKPVVVGGKPESRGVVSSASYEARKFGVRSAMSCSQAQRCCPQAVFVYPNFDQYVKVSHQIREIFHRYTDLVEPLSLDEAYLDVTVNRINEPLARVIAEKIRQDIFKELNLTASAGVSNCKFIAKIASDLKKPNGLAVIPPDQIHDFLETLPVGKLWGVGPVTEKKLKAAGFETAGQIRKVTKAEFELRFGGFGEFLHDLANGIDDRKVEPNRETKSLGSEETFNRDTLDVHKLLGILSSQANELVGSLREMEASAKTVTVKVKYHDFKSITRSRTLFNPTDKVSTIEKAAHALLTDHTEVGQRPIRLIGLSLSQIVDANAPIQLWLDL